MITLKKDKNKDFVILNLTDPQLSFADWDDEHTGGKILKYTIEELVKRQKPDLITVSGDLAWAGSYTSYRNLGNILNSFDIPWSVVWGNHDNQKGPECVNETIKIYNDFSNFTYECGDEKLGNGNYVILIKENDKCISSLIMMDSHDREEVTYENGETKLEWARINKDQIEWYKDTVDELNRIGCDNSILVLHIPIYAYREAFDAAFNKSVQKTDMIIEESYKGTYWNDGYKDSFGVCLEGISSFPSEDGAFDAILSKNHTKTIVCGHDHTNNWVVKHSGVNFVYSLKTGSGCYWNKDVSGGTIIKLDSNGIKEIFHDYINVDHLINN